MGFLLLVALIIGVVKACKKAPVEEETNKLNSVVPTPRTMNDTYLNSGIGGQQVS
jgi:hypothetical protein